MFTPSHFSRGGQHEAHHVTHIRSGCGHCGLARRCSGIAARAGSRHHRQGHRPTERSARRRARHYRRAEQRRRDHHDRHVHAGGAAGAHQGANRHPARPLHRVLGDDAPDHAHPRNPDPGLRAQVRSDDARRGRRDGRGRGDRAEKAHDLGRYRHCRPTAGSAGCLGAGITRGQGGGGAADQSERGSWRRARDPAARGDRPHVALGLHRSAVRFHGDAGSADHRGRHDHAPRPRGHQFGGHRAGRGGEGCGGVVTVRVECRERRGPDLHQARRAHPGRQVGRYGAQRVRPVVPPKGDPLGALAPVPDRHGRDLHRCARQHRQQRRLHHTARAHVNDVSDRRLPGWRQLAAQLEGRSHCRRSLQLVRQGRLRRAVGAADARSVLHQLHLDRPAARQHKLQRVVPEHQAGRCAHPPQGLQPAELPRERGSGAGAAARPVGGRLLRQVEQQSGGAGARRAVLRGDVHRAQHQPVRPESRRHAVRGADPACVAERHEPLVHAGQRAHHHRSLAFHRVWESDLPDPRLAVARGQLQLRSGDVRLHRPGAQELLELTRHPDERLARSSRQRRADIQHGRDPHQRAHLPLRLVERPQHDQGRVRVRGPDADRVCRHRCGVQGPEHAGVRGGRSDHALARLRRYRDPQQELLRHLRLRHQGPLPGRRPGAVGRVVAVRPGEPLADVLPRLGGVPPLRGRSRQRHRRAEAARVVRDRGLAAHLRCAVRDVRRGSGRAREADPRQQDAQAGALGAILVDRPELSWRVNVAADRTRQKITQLNTPPFLVGPDYVGNNDVTQHFKIAAGETFGVIYGTKIVRSLAELYADPAKQALSGANQHWSPDSVIINEDGFLVRKDLYHTIGERYIPYVDPTGSSVVKIADVNPDFNASFTTNLRYKNFSLYALVDWVQGGSIYNGTRQWPFFEFRDRVYDQSSKPVATGCTGSAAACYSTGKKPTDYYQAIYNGINPIDFFVEPGTYVKVKELNVSYSFDRNTLDKLGLGLNNLRLGVIGRNLFTFTKYSGYDPEVAGLSGDPYSFRFDGFSYPNFRTFTGFAEINF